MSHPPEHATKPNLLAQMAALPGLTLDVDSMDPAMATKFPGISFCDMTSNQTLVYIEAVRDENRPLVEQSIRYALRNGSKQLDETNIQDALDLLAVLFAKQVYPFLTGFVHSQVSPSLAFDTNKIVEHATKLVALFEENGIPKERVCIKIPVTPQAVVACKELAKSGINSLGTSLFTVPQAIAASQAGCFYVAPYFNHLKQHTEPEKYWIDYDFPSREHPMAQVIITIRKAYTDMNSKTLIMPASIRNTKEALALASLHPDHITIGGAILEQLSTLPEVAPEQLRKPALPPAEFSLEKDYVANGGALLQEEFDADPESALRVREAMEIFDDMEKKTKEYLLAFKV